MLSRLMTVREQWLLLGVASAIILGAGVLVWRENTAPPPGTELIAASPTAARPAMALNSAPTTVAPSVPPPPVSSPDPLPPEPVRIGVGVLGAVEQEGLYYFDEGARVQELLQAAGGAAPGSDLSNINRTARLIDETTLLVPRLVFARGQTYSDPPVTHNPEPYTRSAWYNLDETYGTSAGTAASPGESRQSNASTSTGGRININTASQGELESLPGIGPVTAQKIIAHRRNQPFQRPGDLENVSGIGPARMAAVRDLITVD